jgi:hypothetical protein
MGADEALAERLEAFLATRGVTREMLVAAVDEPFGPPLLVVATGSVLHGVGNQRSDLDVNVVVEQEVTPFPIASYAHNVLVDMTYFSASTAQNCVSAIRDQPWPPAGRVTREQWGLRRAALRSCTRFGCGLTLSARDGWNRWKSEFRGPWLVAQVVKWWRVESVRRQLAARWLADAKPLLAAHCQLAAVLAALETRAAAAGQLYFGPKWLPEKLRTVDDTEGLDVLRAVMRAPTTEREAAAYTARCEAILNELDWGHHDDFTAQLSYLPGVQVRELDARMLVSRWNLRALELRGATPAVTESPELLWEGALNTLPPSDVLALFVRDMTWLSIGARAT